MEVNHGWDCQCDRPIYRITNYRNPLRQVRIFSEKKINNWANLWLLSLRYGRRTVLILGTLFCGIFGIARAFSKSYILFCILECLDAAALSGTYVCSFLLGRQTIIFNSHLSDFILCRSWACRAKQASPSRYYNLVLLSDWRHGYGWFCLVGEFMEVRF